jgi:PAS domain S-box-containing protein
MKQPNWSSLNPFRVAAGKNEGSSVRDLRVGWQHYDLIERAHFGVWLVDRSGHVVQSNPAGAALLGLDRGGLLGKPLTGFVHAQGQAALVDAQALALQGERTACEARFVRADGVESWLELSFAQADADHVVAYVGDVNSRRQSEAALRERDERFHLEQQRVRDDADRTQRHLAQLVDESSDALLAHQRQLEAILDVFPGVIGSFDPELRVRFANREYSRLFDYEHANVRGAHITDLIGDEWFGRLEPYFRAALHGERQTYQRTLADESQPGGQKHIQVNLIPELVGGQVAGIIAVAFDVTDIRSAQIAAESANRAKSDFLANMSHEIRTPLNSVLGFARLGMEESEASPLLHDFFKRICESGRLLLGVVNDVLDLSKIEAGEMQVESVPMDPRSAVAGAMALFTERARQKGIGLVAETHPSVPSTCLGDPLRLEQVLMNLVSNAIKFTERGQVMVRTHCVGDEIVFAVSDTGIGIGPEHVDRLFRPFEQADSSIARRFGGTGLGLTISQRLVLLMQGTISVRSEPGRGSTFEIRLPLRPAPDLASNPAPAGWQDPCD